MEQGVGSKDYPFKIYGPRKVDLPPVQEPGTVPAGTAKSKAQSILDRVKKSRGKPEITDQSSISNVPANSPMSGLLA